MKKQELIIIYNDLKFRLERTKNSLKLFETIHKTLEKFGDFISPTKTQTINKLQCEIELYEYLIEKIKKEIEAKNENLI